MLPPARFSARLPAQTYPPGVPHLKKINKENPPFMRRTATRLLLALAFASSLALAGLSRPRAAAAQAITSNTNERTQDYSVGQFVPCANNGEGEFVAFTGTIHDILHYSVNDNHALIDTFSNYQGFSGVGLTSGDRYRLTGGGHSLLSFDVNDGAPEADNFITTYNVIGQGQAPNLIFRDTSHFTMNANGEVTVVHSNFVIQCK